MIFAFLPPYIDRIIWDGYQKNFFLICCFQ